VLQEKTSALTIMCNESDKLGSLSLQQIINDFALKKITKNKILITSYSAVQALFILILLSHLRFPMTV
jgi:hypothetical protein